MFQQNQRGSRLSDSLAKETGKASLSRGQILSSLPFFSSQLGQRSRAGNSRFDPDAAAPPTRTGGQAVSDPGEKATACDQVSSL